MTSSSPTFLSVLQGLALLSVPLHATPPEAFEVGPNEVHLLPQGKEADGIQGDFILQNESITALISSGHPSRKANMGGHWNESSPGTLYDLTLRNRALDQLTLFGPNDQRGPVNHVRIVKDGSDGQAIIETYVSPANNKGLYKLHQYILNSQDQGLTITSTLHNQSPETKTGNIEDFWKHFTQTGTLRNIRWANAPDPADKTAYAYTWLSQDDTLNPTSTTLELKPGHATTITRFFTIGTSPAQAIGQVYQKLGPVGHLTGQLTNPDQSPITTAEILIHFDTTAIPAYPDSQGYFNIPLPPGEYPVVIQDIGRNTVSNRVHILRDQRTSLNLELPSPSKVAFDIRDELGQSIPCKVQFHGLQQTPTPNLGPNIRAHGCLEQYHSASGTFETQIPPGTYRVIITHGIEYTHLSREIDLKPSETLKINGTLHRAVDTRGWISTDFHNHSTPSGDNVCGTPDRLINLAAEQVEFAPTTEHNRLYDWQPHIEKLNLTPFLATVSGMELTGSGAHFNAFPFQPKPYQQDNGAPTWNKDPRITAITLRDYQGQLPERWVHLNHPDMVENFMDRNGDGLWDRGFPGLETLIDAAETWGVDILEPTPFYIVRAAGGQETLRYRRTFLWLQMLNRGHRYPTIAVSDAHAVHGGGVGGWRTYVPSSTDNPPDIQWKEIVQHAKNGRMIVTNGPFLTVEAGDGTLPGGSTQANGSIQLHVKVQCTDWIQIDRVQVLVNGRQHPDFNYTRKTHPQMFGQGTLVFDQNIQVTLSEDSHLIVVAYGENSDLKIGYGNSSQSNMNPCAYNNPIYVDVDGNGFTPNGDLLGWPLSVKGITVEEAKKLLKVTP